jgi:hypothetical protein
MQQQHRVPLFNCFTLNPSPDGLKKNFHSRARNGVMGGMTSFLGAKPVGMLDL